MRESELFMRVRRKNWVRGDRRGPRGGGRGVGVCVCVNGGIPGASYWEK